MKQLTAFLLAMIMIATPLSVLSVVSSAEVTPVSPLGGGTFGGGDGSIGNPYIITDVLDLQAMSGNLNAHYVLGNDIDASATAGWNGGQGFNPIGVTMARFNGTFDGQGHRITGLYINRPFTTSVGLFGNIGLGAMISNVTVDNAAVTGYDSTGILVGTVYAPTGHVFNAAVSGIVAGRNGTGGLVGFLGSAVGLHNCSSSASVSGNGYVGGLVGESWKPITDCAASGSVIGKLHGIGGLVGRMWYENITRCHATGAVSTNTSAGMNIGGLVGEQSFVSSTFDSYATGYVTGWGYLGGLVGYFRGDIIRDSHATGDVSSPQNVYRVGGLVGTVGDGSYQNCVIYRCYATGNVDGGTRCGGLLGSTNYEVSECYAIGDVDSTGLSGGLVGVLEDTTSNITDCYATGEVSSSVSDRVGGLVGVSMATITNCYASGPVSGPAPIGGLISSDGGGLGVEVNCFWDTTTSGIATSVGSETGFATAQMLTEATFAGAGWDFAAVWWMADGFTRPFLRMEWDNEITNSHQLQLMAMNLSADYTIENYIDMSDTKVSKEMWGTNATSGKGFSPVGSSASKFVGSLDGQGNIIGYLYIKSTANYVGLFGATNGEISNLEMGTADITGYDYVGALVGRMEGSVINCGSQGTIQGHDNVGGLVGEVYFNANLINASTNIVVNGNAFVGGLAGTHMGTLASEGAAWGQVTGYQYVGGLFGSSQSPVMLSTSHTTVQGAIMVGGFIGDNSYDVEKCAAYGDVIGIGGIKQQIGGFVGSNYGNIRNSYSWGDVAGNYFVGGFIGQEAGTGQIVEDCYSVGQVTALGDVGGFLGEYFMPGTTTAYTDCFWDNQTSNQTASDRGTGKNTEDMMQQTTFMNWNFTNTWGIYEHNTYPFLQALGPDYVPSADLNLTMESSAASIVQLNSSVIFYINITNHGPDNAPDVNVTLTGEGADMNPEFINQTATFWDNNLSWEIPLLASGETAWMLLNLTSETAGTFFLNGTVTSSVTDPVLTNNDAASSLAVNSPPVAMNDNRTIDEDSGPQSVNVLSNDGDLDGDVLTIVSVTQGSHGTVAITYAGKNVTYEPELNWNGNDSFTYTISDGAGGQTDTATVNVSVLAVNDASVPVNDAFTVIEDSAANTLDLLANDYDIENDTITVAIIIVDPTHGSIEITPGGLSVNYTPDQDFVGFDSFVYEATGNFGNATVNITVTAINDAPAVQNDAFTLVEDSNATLLDVLTNDSDVDGDDLTIIAVTQPAGGTVTIIDSGKNLSYIPDADYFGYDYFNYTVSDGILESVAMATVHVTPLNDPPIMVTNSLDAGIVGTAYSFQLNAIDIDSDLLIWNGTCDAGGMSLNTVGLLSGTPTEAGNFTLAVSVSDGDGGMAYTTFTLTIADNDTEMPVDTDGDGTPDSEDAFPNDPAETTDTDGDNVGDNSDAFPDDPAASVDTDNDGLPDAWNPGYTADDSTTGLELDDDPLVPNEGDTESGNMMLYLIIIIVIVAVIAVVAMLARKGPKQPAEVPAPESPVAEPEPAQEPETVTNEQLQ